MKKENRLKINWKKDVRVTGYEVQCSTDKKFRKGIKKYRINKWRTASVTTSSLKSGRRYYVRVRSYKNAKENGKIEKLYGAWKSINVKIKK